MTLTGAIIVFLTSLAALPCSYTFNAISVLKDERLILITGLVTFTLVSGIPWIILRRRLQKVDSFFYVLSLLTFNSVMSLIIALENDGLIAEFMGSYLREGEPYLKTAHGTMMSYWDGIAHYALYLMMLAAVSWNQSFYDVGLYWIGSFGYSKLVLLLAVLMGKDGVGWPLLLHLPCVVISALMSVRFFHEKMQEVKKFKSHISSQDDKEDTKLLSLRKRPMDVILLIYYSFAICITLFRFTAVMEGNVSLVQQYKEKIEPYLSDSLPYPKAQLMINTLYFIPYYGLTIYSLIQPGQSWILSLILVHAGAASQGQFSYMGSSFHYRTPYIHRVPQTALARIIFWLVNGILFILPQIAAYCSLNNAKFYFLKATQSCRNGQLSSGTPVIKKTD
uniref:EXPERA domain-containing protein n=1 Tax=Biomphalaria glabrata TaxID=6526 RepID=A0A2C9JCQ9_BIOGL